MGRGTETSFKLSMGVQLVLTLVVLPVVYGRHPFRWAAHSQYLQTELLRTLAAMLFTYALALCGSWLTRRSVRGPVQSEPRSQLQSLQVFSALGLLIGLYPAQIVSHVGWAWAAPFYGFYFLFLFEVCMGWREYRRAEAPA